MFKIENDNTKNPKVINTKKLSERLFNEYNEKKERREELVKKVNLDNGVTFSPIVHLDNEYGRKVKENFMERNKKMLEDKVKFTSEFIARREKEMRGRKQKKRKEKQNEK